MKRRVIAAFCFLMLLNILTMTAFTVEVPDLDRKGSVSINMTYQGQAVPGGSLTLYRVAQVHEDEDGQYSYRYVQEYADCLESLEDLGDSDTALALAEFTAQNNLSGTTLQIDEEGYIAFTDLELGVYLILQQDAAEGYDLVNPFLVTVPGREEESYIYDVDASPKLALEPEPTEPTEPPVTEPTEPTEPPPPDIPQTGLNQWPIPILAIFGLILVAAGFALYINGKKKSNES